MTEKPENVVRLAAREVPGAWMREDDIFRLEAEFHAAVLAAVARGEHDRDNYTMSCPICHLTMEVVEREERGTWAEIEPACLQFQCDRCGFGGEHQTGPDIASERQERYRAANQQLLRKAFERAGVGFFRRH